MSRLCRSRDAWPEMGSLSAALLRPQAAPWVKGEEGGRRWCQAITGTSSQAWLTLGSHRSSESTLLLHPCSHRRDPRLGRGTYNLEDSTSPCVRVLGLKRQMATN